MASRPRLLIEEWLPAQAIGVECMRERSTGQQPPDKRLHVWWARRPLIVSRAAVLASLLPADFDRATFSKLLGFYAAPEVVVANENLVEMARLLGGTRIANPHGKRAFNNNLREKDLKEAHEAFETVWSEVPTVLDSMAGGGSIPLEAARLGVRSLANELNPVACCVLEATVDYPFRFGPGLAEKARQWGKIWRSSFVERVEPFYTVSGFVPAYTYIFARTVPCPTTKNPTPLVPDWSLLKPKGGQQLVAEPIVKDKTTGEWTIQVREVGSRAGQMAQPPQPTYGDGKGISLFSGEPIPTDYIKAMAQSGQMGSVLYAVATKATSKLTFRPPDATDLGALQRAEAELAKLRPDWERSGVIPTELYPQVTTDERPRTYGMPRWADLFSPRQLLSLGVLVEELKKLRPEIIKAEGEERGEAIVHLLACVIDKFANWNAILASWNVQASTLRSVFDRHDYAFKAAFAEMAACVPGGGLAWAVDSVLEAYEKLCDLPHDHAGKAVQINQGSATNLVHLDDSSVTAVVVDPPYADNVQYSELADFFYVWLKRTQGHRKPEWFATTLCERGDEAVVNIARHKTELGKGAKTADAKLKAHQFYQDLMTEAFREARRVLRDEGVLTVMFTHKQQSAWAALFESLITAGFTITATWPVQTEGWHSLHQAKKNAAQSTVILVARKRDPKAGRGYFDEAMRQEIRRAAQKTATRLRDEGLNAIDQLVGAFGPAMEVFSRYSEVKTDVGERVDVLSAIEIAADAVAQWRVEQLAARGGESLDAESVDAESLFALLCWDVLGAAEFRFNEAMLLGRAVGMDVGRLKETGLVSATGDKVKLLPARERRRDKAVRNESEQLQLLEGPTKRAKVSRKIHPNDEYFASAIDMCHALALRYAENGGGQAGIGAAKGMALQQGWGAHSEPARLMTALVQAAPPATRFAGKGKAKTAADEFPEFRAWHALLAPLFGVTPPEWKPPVIDQPVLALDDADEDETESDESEDA